MSPEQREFGSYIWSVQLLPLLPSLLIWRGHGYKSSNVDLKYSVIYIDCHHSLVVSALVDY